MNVRRQLFDKLRNLLCHFRIGDRRSQRLEQVLKLKYLVIYVVVEILFVTIIRKWSFWIRLQKILGNQSALCKMLVVQVSHVVQQYTSHCIIGSVPTRFDLPVSQPSDEQFLLIVSSRKFPPQW